MTLAEFEEQVFRLAAYSPVCEIPFVRRQMPVSITIRVPLTVGGFVDAFHNQATGTTAFTAIQNDRRIFGADSTGGWHVHPFDDPSQHQALAAPMTFADFLAEMERHHGVTEGREVTGPGR